MHYSFLAAVACSAVAVLLISHYKADAFVFRRELDVKRFTVSRSDLLAAIAGFRRVKRQGISPQCQAVLINVAANQTYQTCVGYMNNFDHLNDFDLSAVNSFCNMRCPNVLINIFKRLAHACAQSGIIPSSETLPQFYQLINQSCYHDDKTQHHLCLVDWVNVNRSLSGSDYQIYESCVTESKSSKDCPSSCRQTHTPEHLPEQLSKDQSYPLFAMKIVDKDAVKAIPYIQQNLGCCYKAYEDFELSSPQGDGVAISDKVYKQCGYQPPRPCKT